MASLHIISYTLPTFFLFAYNILFCSFFFLFIFIKLLVIFLLKKVTLSSLDDDLRSLNFLKLIDNSIKCSIIYISNIFIYIYIDFIYLYIFIYIYIYYYIYFYIICY